MCAYSVDACCKFVEAAKMVGMTDTPKTPDAEAPETTPVAPEKPKLPPEIGGAPGPEPTRYGDWAHKGRCTDF
jgi:hypothetical protein